MIHPIADTHDKDWATGYHIFVLSSQYIVPVLVSCNSFAILEGCDISHWVWILFKFICPKLSVHTGRRMQGLIQQMRTVNALEKSFPGLELAWTVFIHGFLSMAQLVCIKAVGMFCSNWIIVALIVATNDDLIPSCEPIHLKVDASVRLNLWLNLVFFSSQRLFQSYLAFQTWPDKLGSAVSTSF